jgi:hypothetical protein
MKFKSRKEILLQLIVFGSSGFIIGLLFGKFTFMLFLNFEFIRTNVIEILTVGL